MSSQLESEQPPEERGKDIVENHKVESGDASKSTLGWVILASIIVALLIAALSVLNDCTGVTYNSEQCLWSRSLYLVTTGIFFVITFPILLVISWGVWGGKSA